MNESNVTMEQNGNESLEGPKKVLKRKSTYIGTKLQNFHESIGDLTKAHSKRIEHGLKIFFFSFVTAHFAWATAFYIQDGQYHYDSFGDTMCTGYGFSMLLYIFTVIFASYKWLLKPFIVTPIGNYIVKPILVLLRRIFSNKILKAIGYLAILAAALIYLIIDTGNDSDRSRLIPVAGLCVFLLFGYVFSKYPGQVRWTTIIWGMIVQFCFGLLTIRWEVGRNIFKCLGDKVVAFLEYAQLGSAFVYGDKLVFEMGVFAFKALATIYFLNFIINILYHYGIMQSLILSIGRVLQKVLGTSICESVNGAANLFLGQSEAPLLLKPYLKDLTTSEFHTIVTSGFASTSGTVFAAYISFGARPEDLITATVMAAPTALYFSKLFYPETEEIQATKHTIKLTQSNFRSVMDAASKGASEASFIVLNIIANLIGFIAFVYWINGILAWMGSLVGYVGEDDIWSIEIAAGYILTPIAFIMGVPWDECQSVGKLLGIKMIVNEFAAFELFSRMRDELSRRTQVIATFSIVGFANPGSIGLVISALSALSPERSETVVKVVMRGYIAGTIVCLMTASMAGLLITEDMLK
nr:solute carrier family 28 member 3-like [Onthophagus taurus]